MSTEEIWKEIKDYEGYYEISNLGRVRSVERIINNRFSVRVLKPRILKLLSDKNGYNIAVLSKKSKTKRIRVGAEVYRAFVFDYKYPNTIDHVNKIRNDDRLVNLRVLDVRENASLTCNNKSKTPIGICLRKNRYIVRKSINGVRKNVGSFKDLEKAIEAYNLCV